VIHVSDNAALNQLHASRFYTSEWLLLADFVAKVFAGFGEG
jgi:hypothetical protein